MPLNFSYILIGVKDSHGHTWEVVVGDWSDRMQVCGMLNAERKEVYFEAEAYHISTWCATHGLTYGSVTRSESVEIEFS